MVWDVKTEKIKVYQVFPLHLPVLLRNTSKEKTNQEVKRHLDNFRQDVNSQNLIKVNGF